MLYRIFDTEVAFQVVTITYIRRELRLCFHRHNTMLVSILVFFSLLFVKTFCSVVDFPTRFLAPTFLKNVSFHLKLSSQRKRSRRKHRKFSSFHFSASFCVLFPLFLQCNSFCTLTLDMKYQRAHHSVLKAACFSICSL